MRGMLLVAAATSVIYLHISGCDDDVSRLDLVDPTSDHYKKNKEKMAALREDEKQKLRAETRNRNTTPSKHGRT